MTPRRKEKERTAHMAEEVAYAEAKAEAEAEEKQSSHDPDVCEDEKCEFGCSPKESDKDQWEAL